MIFKISSIPVYEEPSFDDTSSNIDTIISDSEDYESSDEDHLKFHEEMADAERGIDNWLNEHTKFLDNANTHFYDTDYDYDLDSDSSFNDDIIQDSEYKNPFFSFDFNKLTNFASNDNDFKSDSPYKSDSFEYDDDSDKSFDSFDSKKFKNDFTSRPSFDNSGPIYDSNSFEYDDNENKNFASTSSAYYDSLKSDGLSGQKYNVNPPQYDSFDYDTPKTTIPVKSYNSDSSYDEPYSHSMSYDVSKAMNTMSYDAFKAGNEAKYRKSFPSYYSSSFEKDSPSFSRDESRSFGSSDSDNGTPLNYNRYEHYGTGYSDDFNGNPKYSFGYSVTDPNTGDYKTQQEYRNGDVVRGSYSLREPDGSFRVVEYQGDDVNGFNAVVKKLDPTRHYTRP